MGSFWEGVDFAQQDRVIEVIARLPFDNPKDPFYQKIESWFSKQGKSTFDSYSLPMTVLRFKQAIGRAQRRPDSAQLFFLWIIARSLRVMETISKRSYTRSGA